MSAELENRFFNLLSKRNWLFHKSRADGRNAINSNAAMQKLVTRIDAIANESISLSREVGSLSIAYVKKHGVLEKYVYQKAEELLRPWQESEEI